MKPSSRSVNARNFPPPLSDCQMTTAGLRYARFVLGERRRRLTSWDRLRAAALAQAAEDDVVLVDPERCRLREIVDNVLEGIVTERLHLAAVPAHEVVVVIPTGLGRFVLRAAGSELDLAHEPELVERLESAVDARNSDTRAEPSNAVVELRHAQAAALVGECRDHRRTRTAGLAA